MKLLNLSFSLLVVLLAQHSSGEGLNKLCGAAQTKYHHSVIHALFKPAKAPHIVIMFHTVVHFPIWQGAGAPHGYARGAGVLRGIAAQHRPVVDIAVEQQDFSESKGNVKAFATLLRHFAKAQAVLDHTAAPVLTIGGDCVADYMSIAHALAKQGERMALLWVDAHPDINTPLTSPSGNFHGMLVRALLGEGPQEYTSLVPHKLTPQQLFYVGARDADMDPEEFRIIAAHKIPRVSVAELEAHKWDGLFTQIRARGFTSVYVHVDSDVMDLRDFPQAVVPVPGGVSAAALIAFLQALRANFPLAGAALTEYSLEFSAGPAEAELGRRLLVDGFGIA
jgi:arginase